MKTADYLANLEPSCRTSYTMNTPERMAEVIAALDPFEDAISCWEAYTANGRLIPQHPRKEVLTNIVKRALVETITDIGQLSRSQLNELEYAVKYGVLSKGKGGPFPILKTVYAFSGFDFAADRENLEAEMRRAHMRDIARGADKFFPWVPFQA